MCYESQHRRLDQSASSQRVLEGVGRSSSSFLVRYACERFLYRLGESAVRDRCILKGATLLALWMKEPYRATRDIDLLAFGDSDEETVRMLITTVCSVPCDEDGITFDLETLRVSPIRDNQKYQGQRANLRRPAWHSTNCGTGGLWIWQRCYLSCR